jgi:hypothetical protein
MFPSFGITEIVIICIGGVIGIGLPIAILVFLYMIYNKVKSIENFLKKE